MARTDAVHLELAGYGGGWTDVTADLASHKMTLTRGFQSGKPDDLVAAPSEFNFCLRNDNKNSALTRSYYSPDSGSLRSGFGTDIRVRWQVTANGNTRTRFLGWIEDIAPAEGLYSGDQTVRIQALSWLNQLATATVAGVDQAVNKRGDELIAILVAKADYPPAGTDYDATPDIFPYALDDLDPAENTALDGADSVTKSGFDRVWEKADGTLKVESRRTRQVYTPPVLDLTDVAPGGQPGLAITKLPGRRNRTQTIKRVQVTTFPRRVDPSTVVLYALDLSTNPSFASGVSVTFEGPYSDPQQQAQRVAGVEMRISDGGSGDVIGTTGSLPTADFAFWSGPGGTGTNVTASVTVTVVYKMNQAILTVTQATGALVYPSLLQCRGRGIYGFNSSTGTATGTGKGGLLTFTCPYQSDPSFGQTAAEWFLGAYSVARTQLEEGVGLFIPATDEVTLDQLHQLDISSPISIAETMLGLSAVPYFINNEAWEVDENGNTTLTYGLGLNLAGVAWALGVAGAGEIGQTTYLRGF